MPTYYYNSVGVRIFDPELHGRSSDVGQDGPSDGNESYDEMPQSSSQEHYELPEGDIASAVLYQNGTAEQ
jgi:hypothetical protein